MAKPEKPKADKPRSMQATVTHLEMTARLRVVPVLPVNLHATLLRTSRIPLHFYRYLQWRVGREFHWVYRLRMADADLAGIIHAPGTGIWVLGIDGAPAGFFELEGLGEAQVNLAYFGLMPHVRGRGLGPWMLGQAMEAAWQGATTRVTVSTNTLDHSSALQLYQRMGFSPVSQTKAIIRPLSDPEIVALMKAE
ncbi:acetyltransferase (GNAT) family protein [Hoeflea marina]|uniref:Acetyltransferase (GNAT) family protein n=1 Tax=Hoeflea marina TaxID=274592 RepID=A0A317PRY4_9HYPH|nr:GNAT family N-acetyltransferase [Hoeflea marina]PWW04233.1 acetyltransferase (GNAT) family protein [Hoeflea marina]